MEQMANPKSKIDHSLTLAGELSLADGTVTEVIKDVGEIEYRFLDQLRQFDGYEITLTVKRKQDITPTVGG